MKLTVDWYEATLECDTQLILAYALLVASEGSPEWSYGKGRHGYHRSINFLSEHLAFTILDEGNGGYPHIIGSGQQAPNVRRLARALGVTGRVSRIDIACDSTEGWISAEKRVLLWADEHPKTQLLAVGDFYRQEKGRTYYIGASTSDRRVRVYEKGVQLGYEPGTEEYMWVRTELQYRPKGREAKEWAFKATTEEIGNSSRCFIAVRALDGFYAAPNFVQKRREPIFALARQYGRVMQEEVPEAYRAIIEYLRNDWRPEYDELHHP